jgi:hypothetical protein
VFLVEQAQSSVSETLLKAIQSFPCSFRSLAFTQRRLVTQRYLWNRCRNEAMGMNARRIVHWYFLQLSAGLLHTNLRTCDTSMTPHLLGNGPYRRCSSLFCSVAAGVIHIPILTLWCHGWGLTRNGACFDQTRHFRTKSLVYSISNESCSLLILLSKRRCTLLRTLTVRSNNDSRSQ